MTRKILFIILAFVTINGLFAQSGTLKGKITDKDTKEPISYATVLVKSVGIQVAAAQANFDGEYIINPMPIGRFNMTVTSNGYIPYKLKGFLVKSDKVVVQNFELSPATNDTENEQLVEYKAPLYDKRNEGNVISVDGIRVRSSKGINRDDHKKLSTIKGHISDKGTKKSIPYAAVQLFQDGNSKHDSPADFDGNYLIKPISPGKYTLYVWVECYKIIKLKNFKIKPGKIHVKNFKLTPSKSQNNKR